MSAKDPDNLKFGLNLALNACIFHLPIFVAQWSVINTSNKILLRYLSPESQYMMNYSITELVWQKIINTELRKQTFGIACSLRSDKKIVLQTEINWIQTKSPESQTGVISFQDSWDTLTNHSLTQNNVNYVPSNLLC